MTVVVPVFVYGTIKDSDGQNQVGASIKISGNSSVAATGYATDITDGDGKYQVNVQDYISDGDTVKVIATYEEYSDFDTFSFTIGDLPKLMNLQFEVGGGVSSDLFRIYHRPPAKFKIVRTPGKVVKFG